ncbi:MAG: TrkH family potassium uptake protein [Rhodobacteraceae bacterium]|nr:TrkH family potassium uptake protein [Paracoccaceae bacterium]MCF8515636.1 TrkH family potassium uptake protein [Paracoccaceae bacterium]MCF8519881.1 TrkH family potassium uptake protein [Paracoccaceae bacterium]
MIDVRPVAYVIGLLVSAMGVFMMFPLALDLAAGDPHWRAFFRSAVICLVAGGATAMASANGANGSMTLQQIFLLTTGVWLAMPAFGALPLILGEPGLSLTDAFFESISGMTTTGTTVIEGIDALPLGTNLWRAILQWLGGLGIVIVAMLFLPVMKVGGMQFFRSEGFDTLGKVLPRALDISSALIQIYVLLTVACAITYFALGMSGFEAVCHALTTVSTGGFSTSDRSFGLFQGPAEYAASIFMLLGSLPFIRFVQLAQGSIRPLLTDSQVRAYLRWNAYAVVAIVAYELWHGGQSLPVLLRETTFNVVSTFSGTGFSSVDLSSWGPFPFVLLIVVGLIGGCTSSTGCSVKVFRYLILFEAIKVQIKRLHNPSSVNPMRYDGQAVSFDVVDSVIVFFTMFILTFGLLAVALGLSGLEFKTAVTAAWTSVANIGPVFGPEVGPTGAVHGFPDFAKWLMMAGMLVGRLELLSVYVLFMRRFWQT